VPQVAEQPHAAGSATRGVGAQHDFS
jgi:hypothetical protein